MLPIATVNEIVAECQANNWARLPALRMMYRAMARDMAHPMIDDDELNSLLDMALFQAVRRFNFKNRLSSYLWHWLRKYIYAHPDARNHRRLPPARPQFLPDGQEISMVETVRSANDARMAPELPDARAFAMERDREIHLALQRLAVKDEIAVRRVYNLSAPGWLPIPQRE